MSLTIPTVTGYSAFWQANSINPANNVPYALLFSRSSHEFRAASALHRSGFRAVRAAMKALTGAAAGGTATDTFSQISELQQGPTNIGPGGARTVSTVTTINRATTAADETFIEARIVDQLFTAAPTSYAVDASGNGGGGKAGR